jgi:hypothetical protein
MTTPLTCACRAGPLNPDDAAPAPDGVPARFFFHRDLATCWAVRKARALAWTPGENGLNNPVYVYEREALQ